MAHPHEKKAAAEGFVIIPRHVVLHPNLTYAQKIVYGRLLSLWSNEFGYCWADNKFIAETSGVRIRTVESAIPALQAVGLVVIENQGNRSRRIRPPHKELRQKPKKERPQNSDRTPAKQRPSSRSSSRTDTYGDTPVEKAQAAERVLAYHEERRKAISPGARALSARARVECLKLIGALLTDDAWTEDRLKRVCDGHLADGSFWRDEGHTHPRYAFRDEVNAERMEAAAEAMVDGPDEEGDDWPSLDEPEEPETWEGLEHSTEGEE